MCNFGGAGKVLDTHPPLIEHDFIHPGGSTLEVLDHLWIQIELHPQADGFVLL